jgi:trans-AT polyketide synthase, acyltransferase and oxidoreductase domains
LLSETGERVQAVACASDQKKRGKTLQQAIDLRVEKRPAHTHETQPPRAELGPAQIVAALRDLRRSLCAVRDGQHTFLTDRLPHDLDTVAGVIPALSIADLGSASFRRQHGLRHAYLCGAMAGGIASVELVVDMAHAGFMGFFGTGALPLAQIEDAIHKIQAQLRPGQPFGMNLLHAYYDPRLEWATVELFLARGVRRVEAAAFVALTPPLVYYRAKGTVRRADGRIATPHHVFAKVSRPEVAAQFLAPPPAPLLQELVASGKLNAEEACLAAQIPMASAITCEADSGGHTDRRPLLVLLPMLLQEREQAMARFGYAAAGFEIPLGAAGGIGEPISAHAAFSLGADYLVTGSINQACRQSGAAGTVKRLLAEADMADVATCPASDMFELGGRVQVLKRGTMYPQRAQRLYDLFRTYPSFDAIPVDERHKVETQILRRPFAEIWQETERYWQGRDPAEAERARTDARHRMALCFRWYLGMSSRWARTGEKERRADYQVWCGPAIGGLNRWTKDTPLALAENRDVRGLARAILTGAAVLRRRDLAAAAGVEDLPTQVALSRPSSVFE